MHRHNWFAICLLVPAIGMAVSTPAPRVSSSTVEQRESRVSKTLARASQFVDVAHVSSQPSCEDVKPPEALTTTSDPPLTFRRALARRSK